MKRSALIVVSAFIAPAVAHTAVDMGSLHLRLHSKTADCTITNESQCGGQNWTGSTCCADPSYECRSDDNGTGVQRCQKKTTTSAPIGTVAPSPATNSSNSFESSDSGDYEYVGDFEECTAENQLCDNETSTCKYYSVDYAECKPETLPSGDLCGQSDGTNEWEYPYCPEGEECISDGTDSWCTTVSPHHRRQHRRSHHTRAQVPLTIHWADVWQDCTPLNVLCKESNCIYHSAYYAQCKPYTLPAGSQCGQRDGNIVWEYDACPEGQECLSQGNDGRTLACTDYKFQPPEVLEDNDDGPIILDAAPVQPSD